MAMRNLFTVLGIVAVFGIFFFFIKPDWVKQIASNPNHSGPTVVTRVNVRLSAERLRHPELPKERGGFLHVDESGVADAASKIVEDIGEDVPSRNSPYLLIINKSNNTMRHCRLGAGVRKIGLKLTYPDVRLYEVPPSPNGPYQVIIWVPQAIDLQLDVDLAVSSPARS